VKNKVAPPFTEAEFEIIFNHGINKEGSIIDVGIDAGVVEKKGAWLQYNGELIGQGKDAARAALVEKPELSRKIVDSIMEKRLAATVATNGSTPAKN
jgi:recombination protein RecA